MKLENMMEELRNMSKSLKFELKKAGQQEPDWVRKLQRHDPLCMDHVC